MVSRRSFLGLVGGAVIVAACGGDDSNGTTAGNGGGGGTGETGALTELSPGVVSSDLHVSDAPQRFAFALLAREGYASGAPARLAVAPQGRDPGAFVATTLYSDGLPARRGVYVAEVVFDSAGVWEGIAEIDGERLPFAFEVREQAQAPVVGAAAPVAASPTFDDALGVDPICTRNPNCGLHTVSLDTMTGAGKPVVVLFATPARCQTQYCGPVLDTLLPLVPDFEDRVTIVHVEIFQNLRTNDLVPTVATWGLPSEPWLYGIDAGGTITARLDGAFGQREMRAVLEDLVAA